jgi:hypothetical protein
VEPCDWMGCNPTCPINLREMAKSRTPTMVGWVCRWVDGLGAGLQYRGHLYMVLHNMLVQLWVLSNCDLGREE